MSTEVKDFAVMLPIYISELTRAQYQEAEARLAARWRDELRRAGGIEVSPPEVVYRPNEDHGKPVVRDGKPQLEPDGRPVLDPVVGGLFAIGRARQVVAS